MTGGRCIFSDKRLDSSAVNQPSSSFSSARGSFSFLYEGGGRWEGRLIVVGVARAIAYFY